MSEDSDDEPISEPRTPSPNGIRRQEYYTEDVLSPPPSPSMSLHSLGMSPLSPLRHSPILRRSAKSPLSSVDQDSQQEEELDQDSRDVLVQRLNDLASRLSDGGELLGDGIANLHARVDEMEQIVYQPSSPKPQRRHHRNPSSVASSQEGAFMLPGLSSPVQPNLSSSRSSSSKVHSSDSLNAAVPQSQQGEPEETNQNRKIQSRVPSDHARRVMRDAEQLHEALVEVIANLKARQEEQDHIHGLLITRAERAAQRIIYLEECVQELEKEQSESEMEILNLQIQLSAIEVQCLGYIPKDADPELMESINHWKAEWDAVKRKRARRKGDAANASLYSEE